jgi:hypothetical protein
MTNRSYINLTALVAAAGGLIVVSSFAFGQVTANWIAFGLSVLALTGSLASLVTAPGASSSSYRAAASVIVAVAAFTIIVSVGVFTGGAQHWLIFGGGTAALALASLPRERYIARLVESGQEGGSEIPEGLRAAA